MEIKTKCDRRYYEFGENRKKNNLRNFLGIKRKFEKANLRNFLGIKIGKRIKFGKRMILRIFEKNLTVCANIVSGK